MKISNETKTGVFVLICLAALLGLLIKVGNFTFFKKGYLIHTRFLYTGGVKDNAPVRLSGVDIGVVKAIRLLYEPNSTMAEVDLWLENGARVRTDAVATVAALGLMGEKYIEIKPGTSNEDVAAGAILKSEEPVKIEDLIEIGKKLAADVSKTAQDISKVANSVDNAITENRPKLDNIFDNLEETSENFNDFSQDVKYHPWKVLAKGKEVPKDQMLRDREAKRLERAKKRGKEYSPDTSAAVATEAAATTTASQKKNFGPAR